MHEYDAGFWLAVIPGACLVVYLVYKSLKEM